MTTIPNLETFLYRDSIQNHNKPEGLGSGTYNRSGIHAEPGKIWIFPISHASGHLPGMAGADNELRRF